MAEEALRERIDFLKRVGTGWIATSPLPAYFGLRAVIEGQAVGTGLVALGLAVVFFCFGGFVRGFLVPILRDLAEQSGAAPASTETGNGA